MGSPSGSGVPSGSEGLRLGLRGLCLITGGGGGGLCPGPGGGCLRPGPQGSAVTKTKQGEIRVDTCEYHILKYKRTCVKSYL